MNRILTISMALVTPLIILQAMGHPPILFGDHEYHDEPWIVIERIDHPDAFRQIDEILPTPNDQRLASGAPGPGYWQQKVDYDIKVTLDATNHALLGTERITYHNQSPHPLEYLWVQIDQNRFRRDSLGNRTEVAPDLREDQSVRWLRQQSAQMEWEGGTTIQSVEGSDGRPLKHSIIDTMMRVELPETLDPGEGFVFDITWSYPIVCNTTRRARSSYEWFEDDQNAIYEIAQWFPRLCPYTDGDGWQNKAFLGSSEFATEFGDYDVSITVPEGFVVASTGELANAGEVLTDLQRNRLREAMASDRPVLVITPEEALANEALERGLRAEGGNGETTWRFQAENVRDFAWAASPKFAWDAWGVEVPGTDRTTLAMSFFPNEGEPLWSRYSTQAVAHAIEVYSHFTVPYPYPVAISVNGPVGGMEYPMICFNGPRPEKDGTYTERTKYGLIGVIIHEVGHNWFPMIINSDERQWTWMDEGLNTFVQYLAHEAWEDEYPSRRGEPQSIVPYMLSERQRPIMTHGESILQRGNNAYAKPATAMNVLRETVLGREQFDYAFREFCRRWAFRRPEPAELFRTMEDASGTDLDWFWRGWFYGTDHVDVEVEKIYDFTVDPRDPELSKPARKAERDAERESISRERNASLPRRTERYPELLDFYNTFDELEVTEGDRRSYQRFMRRLEADDRALIEEIQDNPIHFNVVRFRNHGGVVMPLPLELTWSDGAIETFMLPAEIWKRNPEVFSKLFVSDRSLVSVRLDPQRRIADADRTNNVYPSEVVAGRFGIDASSRRDRGSNPMRDQREELVRKATGDTAFAIARQQRAAWARIEDADRPIDRASELISSSDESKLDGWGRPFGHTYGELGLDKDGADQLLFIELVSAGADGEVGTSDDVAFWMNLMGEFHEGPYIRTVAGDEPVMSR
jgi:hypothetical protein